MLTDLHCLTCTVLKAVPQGSETASSGSNSSSGKSFNQQQQQDVSPLSGLSALADSPGTASSFLTASSTPGTGTNSPSHTPAAGAGAAAAEQQHADAAYGLYEPVLLGVPEGSGAPAGEYAYHRVMSVSLSHQYSNVPPQHLAAKCAGMAPAKQGTRSLHAVSCCPLLLHALRCYPAGQVVLGRITSSSSSTQHSSASRPSSKSLSFDAPAATSSAAGPVERETPMLGIRSRARTADVSRGSSVEQGAEGTSAAAAAAALRAAAAEGGLRSSTSSSRASSSGSEAGPAPAGGLGRLGSSSGSRAGLDPSGRVSAELRQSSSGGCAAAPWAASMQNDAVILCLTCSM